jgi:hypothetical protein
VILAQILGGCRWRMRILWARAIHNEKRKADKAPVAVTFNMRQKPFLGFLWS